jgi:transcriptional regulator with XRE-family HTH domain
MNIDELLRKEIEKSGKTRFRISQESGISEAQLCRFMQGKTFTLATAEILLKYFGYKIKKTKGGQQC